MLRNMRWSLEEAAQTFAAMDSDGDSGISANEFAAFCQMQDKKLEADTLSGIAKLRSELAVMRKALAPNPVEIILKLGLDFSLAGADDSQQRQEFEGNLFQNLSHASGLPPANFKVKHMSPGSIVVNTEINPDLSGKFPDPETVAKDLQRQVHYVISLNSQPYILTKNRITTA